MPFGHPARDQDTQPGDTGENLSWREMSSFQIRFQKSAKYVCIETVSF